jgi:hypothetical protein
MFSEQETSQRGTHQPDIFKRNLNLEKLLWTNSKSKELYNQEILEPTYPVFEQMHYKFAKMAQMTHTDFLQKTATF